MDWRSASPVHQFPSVDQAVTLDQVAESWRTRRVKEGISGSASVSEAFGRVGRIQMGNPGYLDFGHFEEESFVDQGLSETLLLRLSR
ncbi:MAG TPA: hypothetical protein VFY87_28745 [Geminicoccaceae bacterium]|nr:hypothetical protein [Geminicoccaceae bacterium]